MKKEKLMDAMNDLDDALIEKAAPCRVVNQRARIWRFATVAACFVLVVCAVMIALPKQPIAPVTPAPSPNPTPVHPVAPPMPDDVGDVTFVDQTYYVYYLDGDAVACETIQITSMTAREQFFRWCELNVIDAAHCFVDCVLTSNGREVEIHDGDDVYTIQEPGDRLIVKLTVSAEFENYLPDEKKDALLETLKLTFWADHEEAEYQLIME